MKELRTVAALTIASLSMVQAVIAGGLALLALPARHWFGITLGRKELNKSGGARFAATAQPSFELTVFDGKGPGELFRRFFVKTGRGKSGDHDDDSHRDDRVDENRAEYRQPQRPQAS